MAGSESTFIEGDDVQNTGELPSVDLEAESLLPRQTQLDHHPLLPFVIDQEMAMEENLAVVFQVCPRDGLASGVIGIEWRGPENDVLAVERAIALAN